MAREGADFRREIDEVAEHHKATTERASRTTDEMEHNTEAMRRALEAYRRNGTKRRSQPR